MRDLRYLLNFTCADAGRANPDTLAGAVNQRTNRLQVQIPPAVGHIVGMADPMSELRPAPANITNFCHKTEISRTFRKGIIAAVIGWQQPGRFGIPRAHSIARRLSLQTGGSAATVLVVEDVEAVRKMLCSLLKQRGFNCWEAADGVEALFLVQSRTEELHLVLTDVVMPRMTGSELAYRLNSLRPNLPIVFMSGYADDPLLDVIGRLGIPFLSKPFTTDALVQAIRNALSASRSGPPLQ